MPILGEKEGLLGPKERFFIKNGGVQSEKTDLNTGISYFSLDKIRSEIENFDAEKDLKELTEGEKAEFLSKMDKLMTAVEENDGAVNMGELFPELKDMLKESKEISEKYAITKLAANAIENKIKAKIKSGDTSGIAEYYDDTSASGFSQDLDTGIKARQKEYRGK